MEKAHGNIKVKSNRSHHKPEHDEDDEDDDEMLLIVSLDSEFDAQRFIINDYKFQFRTAILNQKLRI